MRTVFDQVFVALEKPDEYGARANLTGCGTIALNDIIPLGKRGIEATTRPNMS
jgi:alcohol dehydrogenase YqhD (iron-dependent ADH family)